MKEKEVRLIARHLISLQPPTRTKIIRCFPYEDKVRLVEEVKVLEDDRPRNK